MSRTMHNDPCAWENEIKEISIQGLRCVEEFSVFVRSPEPSTLAGRMIESARVNYLLDRFDGLVAAGAVRSWPLPVNDLCVDMCNKLIADASNYFNERLSTMSELHEIISFSKLQKRYTAEGCARFQALEMHRTLPGFTALSKMTLRTVLLQTASHNADRWQQSISKCFEVILRSIEECVSIGDARETSGLRSAIREAVSAWRALRNHEPDENGRLERDIMKPYLHDMTRRLSLSSSKLSVGELLAIVDRSLEFEQRLFSETFGHLFDPVVSQRIRTAAQNALVGSNAQRIAQDEVHGIAAALRYPIANPARFRSLVAAIDFHVDARNEIRKVIQAIIREHISELRRKAQSTSLDLTPFESFCELVIPGAVSIYGNFMDTLAHAKFSAQGPSYFHAVQMAVVDSCPADGLVEKAVVRNVDHLLNRSASRRPAASQHIDPRAAAVDDAAVSASASAVDEASPAATYDASAFLSKALPLIRDVKLFVSEYTSAFTSRWFSRERRHPAIEMKLVRIVRESLGKSCTQAITSLVHDVAQRHTAQLPTILNAIALPTFVEKRAAVDELMVRTLPADAASQLSSSSAALATRFKNFDFELHPLLSMAEVQITVRRGCAPPSSMMVRGNVLQVAALIQLQASPSKREPDVIAALRCGESWGRRTIQSLRSAGIVADAPDATLALRLRDGVPFESAGEEPSSSSSVPRIVLPPLHRYILAAASTASSGDAEAETM